jgi:large subunit ribosomal protein L5
MARLKEKYNQEIKNNLQKKLGLSNVMEVPEIKKITVNMGVGEAVQDKKTIEKAVADLEKISGQKVLITRARKSVASFKIREGMPIGVKVTLRRERMYEFLDRLINIALPRVRDFRGLNRKSFDGNGNYSLGVKEQIIFPEIDYDKIDKIRGLDISITTSAKNDEEGLALLKEFNFPIKDAPKNASKDEAEVEEVVEKVDAEPEVEEAEEVIEAAGEENSAKAKEVNESVVAKPESEEESESEDKETEIEEKE